MWYIDTIKYYLAIKKNQTFDIHNIGGFRNYSYPSIQISVYTVQAYPQNLGGIKKGKEHILRSRKLTSSKILFQSIRVYQVTLPLSA